MVAQLLAPYRDVADRLSGPATERPPLCLASLASLASPFNSRIDLAYCQAAMLGCLVQGLRAVDLFPVPRPEEVESSASELAEKLKSLDFKALAGGIHKCHPVPQAVKQVDAALRDLRPVTTEEQARVLADRAAKSRLQSTQLDPDNMAYL